MSPPTTNIQFFFTDWIPFLSPTNSVKALKGTFHLLTIYLCTLLLPNESGKNNPLCTFPQAVQEHVRWSEKWKHYFTAIYWHCFLTHRGFIQNILRCLSSTFEGLSGAFSMTFHGLVECVEVLGFFNTVNATSVAHCYRKLYKLLCHSASNYLL